MIRRSYLQLCNVYQEMETSSSPTTSLTKTIWKASVRSIRVQSTWESFSKQVISQLPLLDSRDIATVIHSFARVKFKDEKLLGSIIPSILRNLNDFSVREIVSILSAFRKLEYSRLDCMDLLVNQLVIQSNEWNEIDCALIANALGYFRVFDKDIWKCIQNHILKRNEDLSPLGIGLIVGALAKLDMRNERLLRKLSRTLVNSVGGVMKQESFAIIVHGFYKLDWTEDFILNEFLECQMENFLQLEAFFDKQSLCMILHALFCYRVPNEAKPLTEQQNRILVSGIESLLKEDAWKPDTDQLKRLNDLVLLYNDSNRIVSDLGRFIAKNRLSESKRSEEKKTLKLPRWEYEVFRILKEKMQVPVRRNKKDKRVDLIVPRDGEKDVVVLCLGPFQFYADSTKRTASSKSLQRILEAQGRKVMEIPFFIWNELKSDEDKVMYVYSLGRRVYKSTLE